MSKTYDNLDLHVQILRGAGGPPTLKNGELYYDYVNNKFYIGVGGASVQLNVSFRTEEEVNAYVVDGVISGDKLKDNSIDVSKLKKISEDDTDSPYLAFNKDNIKDYIDDGAVGTNQIADGAITSDKMGRGAITSDTFTDNCIKQRHIAAGQVGTAQLIDNCITEGKISNKSINHNVLQDNCVWENNIKDGSITHNKLTNGCIGTMNLDSTLKYDTCVAVEYYGPQRTQEAHDIWVINVKKELAKSYQGTDTAYGMWNYHQLLFPTPQKDGSYREVCIFYLIGAWSREGFRNMERV